jgi:DNA-binding MarR family transcriptional regulator
MMDTVLDYESAAPTEGAPQVRLLLRLLSCTRLLEQIVRRGLRREFEMTLPMFDVLAQLYRAPDGLSMGALSQRLMVTSGNVTGIVRRLVGLGLVRQAPAPEDQRVQIVRFTRKGLSLFERITPRQHAWVSEAMDGLSARDTEELYTRLADLKRSVLAHAETGEDET